MTINEWTTAEHALHYLAAADRVPHRTEGESLLLEFVPATVRRILDLGTGDGWLLALLRIDRPGAEGVALDFSPTMLARARDRFRDEPQVRVVEHNLDDPLPTLGTFDAIVSSFAIHHCEDQRKRALYAEIYDILEPGGMFLNLEHVASATDALHDRFVRALSMGADRHEDPSNKLAAVALQTSWLRDIGFVEVDCYWKWLELALFGGVKPA